MGMKQTKMSTPMTKPTNIEKGVDDLHEEMEDKSL